jgi:uncharacterized protein (DUF3084 family)
MLSSDEDNSKNSLDTLRSSIFESRAPSSRKAQQHSAYTPHKSSHTHRQNNSDSYLSKENMSDVLNINKTAVESELLGARLTEEIRRLRSELGFSVNQTREVTQQLQSCQQENDALRAKNKELEWSNDAMQRDRVSHPSNERLVNLYHSICVNSLPCAVWLFVIPPFCLVLYVTR